jgi:hypothetical protein
MALARRVLDGAIAATSSGRVAQDRRKSMKSDVVCCPVKMCLRYLNGGWYRALSGSAH